MVEVFKYIIAIILCFGLVCSVIGMFKYKNDEWLDLSISAFCLGSALSLLYLIVS